MKIKNVCICLPLMLGSLTAVSANAQTNLLQAGDFEGISSLDGYWPTTTGVWGVEGSIELSGATSGVTPASGTQMLQAWKTGGGSSQTMQIVAGPFISDSTATFSVKVNSDGSGVGGVISIIGLNAAGSQITRLDSPGFTVDSDSGTWETVTFSTVLDSDWNSIAVEIVYWTGTLGGSPYYKAGPFGFSDDAVLTVVPPVIDTDGDGVPDGDENGQCLSTDLAAPVSIGGIDSGIDNTFFAASGCAVSDLVDNIVADCSNARNHGKFVSCVALGTNTLKSQGVLTGREKGALQRAAAHADIP